jgi:hypothetical protein
VETGAQEVGFAPISGGLHGLELELPSGSADYDWLEIRGELAPDWFTLTDRPTHGNRAIAFRTLEDEGDRYLVRVGSCPQWRGYGEHPLLLLHNRAQDIVSIRLLESAGA